MLVALWLGSANFVRAGADTLPGDPVRGEQVYQRCLACHALAYNRTGPRHCGVIGRRAGSLDDFQYSPAMRAKNLVWTAETLDAFLKAPTLYVPGTTMGYAGVEQVADRRDLIAFLVVISNDSERCAVTTGEGLE